jgi:hypothetical protein
MKKKNPNLKRKKSKTIKIMMIFLIFLVIAFVIILLLDFGALDSFVKMFKEPKKYNVNDKCSLIMNNILHQIKNTDDCKIRCKDECNLRTLEYYSSDFEAMNNSCNTCECYCK